MEQNFSTLKVNHVLVKDMQLLLKGRHDHNRMYVVVDENNYGFVAVVVRFVSCTAGVKDHWLDDGLSVEVEHEIWASSDGVRHHHVMKDEEGYLHYPDLEFQIAIYQKLMELELKHCKNSDRFDEGYKNEIIDLEIPEVDIEEEPTDAAIALSIKPLEVCPLAVSRMKWSVVNAAVKLMDDYGLELTPSNKNIAPSIYDAVAQQRFYNFLDNQNAEDFIALLVDYKLVQTTDK